jgi:hypothetical protein
MVAAEYTQAIAVRESSMKKIKTTFTWAGAIMMLLIASQTLRANGISFVIVFGEDCTKGIFGAGKQQDLLCNVVNGIPTLTYNPAADKANNFITPGDVILTEAGLPPTDPNANSDILRFSRLTPDDPKGARKLQFLSDGEQPLNGTVGTPKVLPEVDLSKLKPIVTSSGAVGPFDGTGADKNLPNLQGRSGALYIAGIGDIGGPTSNSIAYIFISDGPGDETPEPSTPILFCIGLAGLLFLSFLLHRHPDSLWCTPTRSTSIVD